MNKKTMLCAVIAAMLLLCSCNAAGTSSSSGNSFSSASAPSSVSSPEDEYSVGEESSEAEESEPEEEPEPVVPELLKKIQVTIDGDTIELPMKFSELEALGFVPDEEDIQKDCEPDKDIGIIARKGELVINVFSYNYSDQPIGYQDTYVIDLGIVSSSSIDAGGAVITLPGGLQLWKSTYEDALALYGEPTQREDDGVITNEWQYDVAPDVPFTSPPVNRTYRLVFRSESGVLDSFMIFAHGPLDQADIPAAES